jgi:hypothetical protein
MDHAGEELVDPSEVVRQRAERYSGNRGNFPHPSRRHTSARDHLPGRFYDEPPAHERRVAARACRPRRTSAAALAIHAGFLLPGHVYD